MNNITFTAIKYGFIPIASGYKAERYSLISFIIIYLILKPHNNYKYYGQTQNQFIHFHFR